MSQFINNVDRGESPQKIDSGTENVTYVGYPDKGATVAQPKWAIKRISTVDGVITIEWAGGSLEKKHIWSNRTSLTYSMI